MTHYFNVRVVLEAMKMLNELCLFNRLENQFCHASMLVNGSNVKGIIPWTFFKNGRCVTRTDEIARIKTNKLIDFLYIVLFNLFTKTNEVLTFGSWKITLLKRSRNRLIRWWCCKMKYYLIFNNNYYLCVCMCVCEREGQVKQNKADRSSKNTRFELRRGNFCQNGTYLPLYIKRHPYNFLFFSFISYDIFFLSLSHLFYKVLKLTFKQCLNTGW